MNTDCFVLTVSGSYVAETFINNSDYANIYALLSDQDKINLVKLYSDLSTILIRGLDCSFGNVAIQGNLQVDGPISAGTDATLTYNSTSDSWSLNKGLDVSGVLRVNGSNLRSYLDSLIQNVDTSFTELRSYLDGSFALIKNVDTSLRSYVDGSFAVIKNVDTSFTELRSYLDGSFALIKNVDTNLRSYVDASFALIQNVDTSFTELRSYLDGSFALIKNVDTSFTNLAESLIKNVDQSFTELRSYLDSSFIKFTTLKNGSLDISVNNLDVWGVLRVDGMDIKQTINDYTTNFDLSLTRLDQMISTISGSNFAALVLELSGQVLEIADGIDGIASLYTSLSGEVTRIENLIANLDPSYVSHMELPNKVGELLVQQRYDASFANVDISYMKVAYIGSDLVPLIDNYYDLGISGNRWKSIHIGPGTIYMTDICNGYPEASLSVNQGVLQINGANQLPVGQLKFAANNIVSTTETIPINIGSLTAPSNIGMLQPVRFMTSKIDACANILSIIDVDNSAQTLWKFEESGLTFPNGTKQLTAYNDVSLNTRVNNIETHSALVFFDNVTALRGLTTLSYDSTNTSNNGNIMSNLYNNSYIQFTDISNLGPKTLEVYCYLSASIPNANGNGDHPFSIDLSAVGTVNNNSVSNINITTCSYRDHTSVDMAVGPAVYKLMQSANSKSVDYTTKFVVQINNPSGANASGVALSNIRLYIKVV